jgi:hypothetical protein
MKGWEYEAITEAANATEWDCQSNLCGWPELQEALTNNGMPLLGYTRMKAVKEICRLILAERKTADVRRGSDLVKQLQTSLLERGLYVNPTDTCECYRHYSETYEAQSWVENLATWGGADHVDPVTYIAARICK